MKRFALNETKPSKLQTPEEERPVVPEGAASSRKRNKRTATKDTDFVPEIEEEGDDSEVESIESEAAAAEFDAAGASEGADNDGIYEPSDEENFVVTDGDGPSTSAKRKRKRKQKTTAKAPRTKGTPKKETPTKKKETVPVPSFRSRFRRFCTDGVKQDLTDSFAKAHQTL